MQQSTSFLLILPTSSSTRFDYLHKKQSGGAGQYGRVIGEIQVSIKAYVPPSPSLPYVPASLLTVVANDGRQSHKTGVCGPDSWHEHSQELHSWRREGVPGHV